MVDGLVSILTIIFVLVNFSKVAPEPLWKSSSFSFQFHLGQPQLSCGLSNMSQRSCSNHPHQNGTISLTITLAPVLIVGNIGLDYFNYFWHPCMVSHNKHNMKYFAYRRLRLEIQWDNWARRGLPQVRSARAHVVQCLYCTRAWKTLPCEQWPTPTSYHMIQIDPLGLSWTRYFIPTLTRRIDDTVRIPFLPKGHTVVERTQHVDRNPMLVTNWDQGDRCSNKATTFTRRWFAKETESKRFKQIFMSPV
jgi:hypothetical protein